MKKKYFLRGLGAGIIMSVVILSATTKKNELSNEEIKRRAAKLGMIEKESALDQVLEKPAATEDAIPVITDMPKETEKPEETNSPTKEPEATQAAETEKPKITDAPLVTESPDVTKQPEKEPEKPKYVTVVISAGMWSEEIAGKFQQLKLVDSAEAFDDYLCDNGYASNIKVGEYKIPLGATYKQIAEIITK